jgi:hypothetical protein
MNYVTTRLNSEVHLGTNSDDNAARKIVGIFYWHHSNKNVFTTVDFIHNYI